MNDASAEEKKLAVEAFDFSLIAEKYPSDSNLRKLSELLSRVGFLTVDEDVKSHVRLALTTITGMLKLLKDGNLTLLAGKKKITAKLAQEVAVNVDSKDYSLAPTGSLIEADGYETKDGSVNAKKIVITLGKVEKPTGPPQEVKTTKTERKKKEEKK